MCRLQPLLPHLSLTRRHHNGTTRRRQPSAKLARPNGDFSAKSSTGELVSKPNAKPTGSPNADASRIGDAQIAFIGCGIMGETMIAGLINNRYVPPEQIVASHPRNERIKELNEKYGVRVFQDNARAAKVVAAADKSIVVLSVKPQRLPAVLRDLQAAVDRGQLIVSIVAGATIKS